jgi:hypothetical protein
LESTDSNAKVRRQCRRLKGSLSLFSIARRITKRMEKKHRIQPECARALRDIFDRGKVDVRGFIADLHT